MTLEEVISYATQSKVILLSIASALVIALVFAAGLLKPGGFQKAGVRKTEAPWTIWFFAAIIVYVTAMTGGELIEQSSWVASQDLTDFQYSVLQRLTAALLGVIAAGGMLYIMNKSCPDAGLKTHSPDLAVGFGCFILAWPLIELASVAGYHAYVEVTEGTPPPAIAHETLGQIIAHRESAWGWGLAFAAVILRPIIEEIVYRVFVQSAFIRMFKSPWISVLLSSLLFALAHRLGSEPVPWHALIPLFVLGLCCGIAYERTKRVGVPITMHICFNALNVALAFMVSAQAAEAAV